MSTVLNDPDDELAFPEQLHVQYSGHPERVLIDASNPHTLTRVVARVDAAELIATIEREVPAVAREATPTPQTLDDALEHAWETAEVGLPEVGDRIITRSGYTNAHSTHEYFIGLSQRSLTRHDPFTRILERTPKPGWHDAQVIRATHASDRLIFVRGDDRDWHSPEGIVADYEQDALTDVEIILGKDD